MRLKNLSRFAMKQISLPQRGRPILLALMLASAASCGLVFLRLLFTGQFQFWYLPANLALAWIPLFFSFTVYGLFQRGTRGGVRICLYAFLWLIFLPNAPYIVTDLIHLHPRPPVPIWFDMMTIVSFAGTGFLLGFTSLYVMQRIVAETFGRAAGWLFVLLVLGLTGLGIYIGRFLRWSSWDLLVSPMRLATDLVQQFSHPCSHPAPILYTFLFAKVCLVGYLTLYAMTHLKLEEEN